MPWQWIEIIKNLPRSFPILSRIYSMVTTGTLLHTYRWCVSFNFRLYHHGRVLICVTHHRVEVQNAGWKVGGEGGRRWRIKNGISTESTHVWTGLLSMHQVPREGRVLYWSVGGSAWCWLGLWWWVAPEKLRAGRTVAGNGGALPSSSCCSAAQTESLNTTHHGQKGGSDWKYRRGPSRTSPSVIYSFSPLPYSPPLQTTLPPTHCPERRRGAGPTNFSQAERIDCRTKQVNGRPSPLRHLHSKCTKKK